MKTQMKKRQTGLSLIELLIGTAVMAVLGALLMGIFARGAGRYNLETRQMIADARLQNAFRLMERAARHAAQAEIDNGRLLIWQVMDTNPTGQPMPALVNGQLVYRTETAHVYYLSDMTGSLQQSGNCLWVGERDAQGTITPSEMLLDSIHRFDPQISVSTSGILVSIDIETRWTFGDHDFRSRTERKLLINCANTSR